MTLSYDLPAWEQMRGAAANTVRRQRGKTALQAFFALERAQETLLDALRDLGAESEEGAHLSLAELRRVTGFGDERVKTCASRLEAEGKLKLGPRELTGRRYWLPLVEDSDEENE